MATARHTIELNGQLYDAVTGELLNKSPKSTPPAQVMDGFVRPKHQPTAMPITPSPTAKKHRVSIQDPKPAPKPAKRSATLMRRAVKKPVSTTSQANESPVKKPRNLPAHRLHRANTTNKSALISRFGNDKASKLSTQVASVPVQAPPVTPALPLLNLRQQIEAVTGHAAGAKQVFERALLQADSHKQPKPKKTKLSHRFAAKIHVAPRLMGLASGFAAALLIAAFFLYQNMPQLSMRLAATRAGVAASLPEYRPAGFSMSRQIQYSPGEIKVSYHSNSDERAFELVQKKAPNPQGLIDEVTDGQPYQAYQENGLTIYIYKGSNAAWVNEGVLYQIEGDSALNSDQLIRLATSI